MLQNGGGSVQRGAGSPRKLLVTLLGALGVKLQFISAKLAYNKLKLMIKLCSFKSKLCVLNRQAILNLKRSPAPQVCRTLSVLFAVEWVAAQ